jgi:hypothetical protein
VSPKLHLITEAPGAVNKNPVKPPGMKQRSTKDGFKASAIRHNNQRFNGT